MPWKLPVIPFPDTEICIQVKVPNDPAYIDAFFGQLLDLATAYNWANDDAHTALLARDRMRQMYLEVRENNCPDCVPFNPCGCSGCGCEECMNSLRFNCGVLEQYDCITQSWIPVPSTGDCAENPAPGAGAPQPPPGQASGNVCFKAEADALTPLPWLVNTGDILDFTSVLGAGNDGSSLDYYCPDGSIFFVGACAGGGGVSGSDPLPTTKHMALLLKIGSSYYPLSSGAFTVPSSISNQQVFVQVNTPTIANARGEYTLCVNFQNNQAGQWRAHIDFTRSAGGFVPVPLTVAAAGLWSPGVGWIQSLGQNASLVYVDGVYMNLSFASTINITGVTWKGSKSDGNNINPSNICWISQNNAGSDFTSQFTFGAFPSSPFTITGTVALAATSIDMLLWDYEFGGPGIYGTVTITDLYLTGTGTIPPELAAFSY